MHSTSSSAQGEYFFVAFRIYDTNRSWFLCTVALRCNVVHVALVAPLTKSRTCLFFSEIMAPNTLAATRRTTSHFESTGLRLLLLLYTFIACTAVSLSDIVFICDVIISAARQISSVLSIVSPVSRNKRSLAL